MRRLRPISNGREHPPFGHTPAGITTPQERYSPRELAADRAVHIFGLSLGAFGSIAMIGLAIGERAGRLWPILIYSACLIGMLGCSAAYHLARRSPRRALLRRLDHAAIFVMIAGTYTPFTACVLQGGWSVAMTGSVWTTALAGAFIKLRYPGRLERIDLALYLGLGWVILVAWRPLLAGLDLPTTVLILAGGILYSVGAGFHAWRSLPFQNAIWHGFVLGAASCHYAAVLHGVLLADGGR